MAAERGLEDLPAVCVVADVCRDELLFEMDAEAAFNNRVQEVKDLRVQAAHKLINVEDGVQNNNF